jgi:glycosyltransferase involved in cell wall biosynthesis
METTSAGGINKTVREIAKNLSKMGNEVTVLQANPFNLPDEEIYEGFKIIRIKSKFRGNFYGFHPEIYFYLKKHLKNLNPDIIHVHGYHTLFSPEIIWIFRKIDTKVPLVFSPYLDEARSTFVGKYFWKPYNSFIGHKIFESVDYTISSSEFEAKNILRTFNINSNKTSVISLGIDVIDIKKSAKKNSEIRLLYSGYLIKRKCVNYLLESLHSLVYQMRTENVVLTIIGEGPEEKKLLKLADKLQINDKVKWKKFQTRKNQLNEIRNSDIFLLLSESEAFGIVVAEALALGTPVIITKKTALNEFLNEPGCFGVNYPPNPSEVAELILKIYESNMNVGRFSTKIRTWDTVAKDYETVYSKILNEAKVKEHS